MSDQGTIAPTLFELLAREWNIGVAVQSLCFNARQSAVGYALDNGSVMIAHVSDDDPAEQRIHVSAEDGRQTIRPRAKSPKPLVMVEVENSGPIQLGALGNTDFVAGGTHGSLYRISPNGDKTIVNPGLDDAVSGFCDCVDKKLFACSSGSRVTIFDDADMTAKISLDAGIPIAAIGFSPNGSSIAATHERGMTIWTLDGGGQKTAEIEFNGRPSSVHWNPEGGWIAAPLADGGFQLISLHDGRSQALSGYPSPVNSIAWNKKANALVTSGAFRVTAWSMNEPPIADPSTGALQTGITGFVPISSVSCHPDRNLVVAGYDNGFISIMQIGGPDEMVLNSEDHGAVIDLVWSRDARHIACGTDKGLAALISIPPQMFK